MEVALYPVDPLNEGFGFTLQVAGKDGKVWERYSLTFDNAYVLLGIILREAREMVEGGDLSEDEAWHRKQHPAYGEAMDHMNAHLHPDGSIQYHDHSHE